MIAIYDAYSKEIDEQIKIYSNTLTSGAVQSMEQYREFCGEIKGLIKAKNIFKDLITSSIETPYLNESDNSF